MDTLVETLDLGKLRAEIHYDEMGFSPREDDNLGIMACFHRRYDLGDEVDIDHNDFNSWDEMEDWIIRNKDVGVILPLYLYDHSGITISTGSFGCPWDSGQIGFIYATKEQIRKEFNCKLVTKKIREKVEKILLGEVETYDLYVRGEVYGYKVFDKESNEEVDSCWGYLGYDHIEEEIKAQYSEETN